MKLSKPLSALILIVSALLLSAANEGPAPNPSPAPIVALTQTHAQHEAREAQHKPIEILILKDWSDYGLLYVAGLVGLIALFQYLITRLAYVADRPYVIVGKTTLLNLTTFERMTKGLALTTASIRVENVGKRPAIIDEVRGELLLLPDASGGGIPVPPAKWGNIKKLRLAAPEKRVIAGKGSIEILVQYQLGLLSEDDYNAVTMTYEKILVVAGLVRYRPVAGWWHRYKTTFGLRYNPPGFLGEKDFFNVGPSRYNRNT